MYFIKRCYYNKQYDISYYTYYYYNETKPTLLRKPPVNQLLNLNISYYKYIL